MGVESSRGKLPPAKHSEGFLISLWKLEYFLISLSGLKSFPFSKQMIPPYFPIIDQYLVFHASPKYWKNLSTFACLNILMKMIFSIPTSTDLERIIQPQWPSLTLLITSPKP